MSNIVIEAFSKEEGNVTTEKYHGGQFRKIIQANQFLELTQASKQVILNRLKTSYYPSTEDRACETCNAPVLGKNNMDVP